MKNDKLERYNVMLDRDDVRLLDEFYPNQRSILLRGMIRRFVQKNIEPKLAPKEPADE